MHVMSMYIMFDLYVEKLNKLNSRLNIKEDYSHMLLIL